MRLLVATYALALVPLAALRFDLAAVAAYAACDKLASVAGALGLLAAQALAPAAARRNAVSPPPMSARWLWATTSLAVTYMAATSLFGGVAVAWLFGPRYAGLGAGATVTFLADGLVGVNTVVWSGLLLPGGREQGYGRATAAGALACYAVLLAPLRGGYLQIASARLVGEVAVLALSLPRLWAVRPPPALQPAGAAA